MAEQPFDVQTAQKADWKHWVTTEGLEGSNLIVAAREGRKGSVHQEKVGGVVAGDKRILNVCQDSLNVFRGKYKELVL